MATTPATLDQDGGSFAAINPSRTNNIISGFNLCEGSGFGSSEEATEYDPTVRMHDFCFTYPYGFLVLFGGLFGFLRKGSTTSLMGGVGSGALLLLAAYKSHQDYLRGSKSSLALFLETVVAVALTWVMGQRFMVTSKFMPAGMVAALSGIMSLFYLYKVATGGNRIIKKEA
uniref:Uncharacterized protein n=1 Tax=Physcomitrium patens TaxID=3218 RepID=A0A7I4CNP5_PHYPA